jgi:hypothetical protein
LVDCERGHKIGYQLLTDTGQIVITLKSKIVEAFFKLDNDTGKVQLRSGLQIQMFPSIRQLKIAQKHQCAAFIQDGSYLLVWDDDPNKLIERAADLERQLVEISWRTATGVYPKGEQRQTSVVATREELLEAGMADDRKPTYINSYICALTLCLSFLIIGLGLKTLVKETIVDMGYARLATLAFIPVQFFMSLVRARHYTCFLLILTEIPQFFMQVVIVCIFQFFGPIGQCQANTKYYSGQAPHRLRGDSPLPHVTIQCPIYTEGLEAVVEPTIRSLKAAISTYEMQGGSANIFVNDDGILAKLSKKEIESRKRFYKKHNIGWVGRPAQNTDPTDGSPMFLRRGRFKKVQISNKCDF